MGYLRRGSEGESRLSDGPPPQHRPDELQPARLDRLVAAEALHDALRLLVGDVAVLAGLRIEAHADHVAEDDRVQLALRNRVREFHLREVARLSHLPRGVYGAVSRLERGAQKAFLVPEIVIGNEFVDAALAKGGLDNQLWTISLVILAVSFGGALERCGSIERLFAGLKRMLNRVGTLTGCTLLTSVFCDAVMCDQFLGIGIPAPLYADKYDEMGLARNMLSRTLEDAGTMWSPMFPWTACGAYQMSTLGISPLAYFPFAFVNLLNPIYAFVTAMLGRNIFWADGAYTNILGKTRPGNPAESPDEAREVAFAALKAARAAGKAPVPEP